MPIDEDVETRDDRGMGEVGRAYPFYRRTDRQGFSGAALHGVAAQGLAGRLGGGFGVSEAS